MRIVFLILLLIAAKGFSQCKTYMLGVKGDTLNCTDIKNLKQGKWIVRVESVRGEPGYEEEGIYINGKKEGTWRVYSLVGDLIAIENYRWGAKDGIWRYFTIQGIQHEESWKAIDPLNPYDTVKVYDVLQPDVYTTKIVKVESASVRQGTWKYFDPLSGAVIKTDEYVLDQLIDPTKPNPYTAAKPAVKDSTASASTDTASQQSSVSKPPEVLEYEKKNSNKKKIKVREGHTGIP